MKFTDSPPLPLVATAAVAAADGYDEEDDMAMEGASVRDFVRLSCSDC
jgi:hypothetical protein